MFIIIWEFLVGKANEFDFEKTYGSDGDWAELFRHSDGYLGTELLRDENHPHRYVTIDRWFSSTAYENFKQRWEKEYQAIDEQCNGLTEQEVFIGSFALKE